MSQTAMPFWYWHQPGAFFGMPYQNFAGWMGTGAVFMAIAALIWGKRSINFRFDSVNFPLFVYLGNFAFAMVMSLAAGIWIPVLLGLAVGVAPAVACWAIARKRALQSVMAQSDSSTLTDNPIRESVPAQVSDIAPVGAVTK
jgi:putative membrane protein